MDTTTWDQRKRQQVIDNKMSTCLFCNKEFKKESTLFAHICEKKRRDQQKNEQHVQIGLSAYLRFFKKTQHKDRTYNDFANSQFYSAFVRFGTYTQNVFCINVRAFTDWLIDNNIPLDKWPTDKNYDIFLKQWIFIENHMDAAERSISNMLKWADENKLEVYDYFIKNTTSAIIEDIKFGKISPWIIYGSHSGVSWLGTCHQEQLRLMWEIIDPDKWAKKLTENMSVKNEIADLCKKVGL